MRVLGDPSRGPWLALRPGVTMGDLRRRILRAQVCISDLDDTDAPSPAKRIVLRHLLSWRALDPRFVAWMASSALAVLRNLPEPKLAESARWRSYVATFLAGRRPLERARSMFDKATVKESLYPGVIELSKLLPGHKLYLTRNVLCVGEAYARLLGVHRVVPELYDKRAFIEDFIRNSTPTRFFVKGDSREDEEMIDVLRWHQQEGRVEDVVGCYRADAPTDLRMSRCFDANVGKDYSLLLDLLRGSQGPG